jgi:hypothetical protein
MPGTRCVARGTAPVTRARETRPRRKAKFEVGQVVKYRYSKRWYYFCVTRIRIGQAFWYMDDEGNATIQRRLRALTKRERGQR